MLYGADVWDPRRIIAQIIGFQCYYYGCLGVLVFLLVGPYVPQVNLFHIFDWRWIQFHSFITWMEVLTFVLAAMFNALYLRYVVKRAKRCLDFSMTLYLLHLVIVWLSYGFPRSLSWWLTMAGCAAATATLGEWVCMLKELQDIPLASLSTQKDRKQSEMVRQIPILVIDK